jgi:hypothetical protein
MNKPKYPIYVISKGRYENCLTAKFLIEATMAQLTSSEKENLNIHMNFI